eukprot:1304739-Prymnesium_polylepis.1
MSHHPEPRRYTVSAVSCCSCAVSVLYLALYFWYGGASGGATVSVLYRCCTCIAAVSLLNGVFVHYCPTAAVSRYTVSDVSPGL